MVQETAAAKYIRSNTRGSRYDAACKRLLAEKIFLAWIVKACVREFTDFDVEEIAEKYIEGMPEIAEIPVLPDEMEKRTRVDMTGVEDTTVEEGTITFDIRFRVVLPKGDGYIRMLVNVEAQNSFYPGYPLIKRGIYYGSRMISSQYGVEFVKSHYEKIKKVYSIWICMNPPKKRENSITNYRFSEQNTLGDVKEKPENYDLIEVVMVCLGKFDENRQRDVIGLLNLLLTARVDATTKKQILEYEFQIPMREHIEKEVTQMCNLSEGVRQEGREAGREELLKEQISKKMKKGKSVEQIAEELEEAVETIQKLYDVVARENLA